MHLQASITRCVWKPFRSAIFGTDTGTASGLPYAGLDER